MLRSLSVKNLTLFTQGALVDEMGGIAAHSKLFRRAIDPADVAQTVRRKLRAVDAHPLVVASEALRGLSWRVVSVSCSEG